MKKVGKKDHGIWEIRVEQEHFTYSKVMCWVGIDRLLKMKNLLELTERGIQEFQSLKKEIYDWIWQNCYDSVNKTFLQNPNVPHQDATNFLFVLLEFLDQHDPLTKTIIQQTAKELSLDKILSIGI